MMRAVADRGGVFCANVPSWLGRRRSPLAFRLMPARCGPSAVIIDDAFERFEKRVDIGDRVV